MKKTFLKRSLLTVVVVLAARILVGGHLSIAGAALCGVVSSILYDVYGASRS